MIENGGEKQRGLEDMNARFQEKTSHPEDCVLWFGPLLAGNIKRPSQRLQLPQWSLTCTGPMAGLIKECEWKHDVNGTLGKEKMVRHVGPIDMPFHGSYKEYNGKKLCVFMPPCGRMFYNRI